ncbi:MAG: hypothetical protein GY716_24680 [bacterium]|nr:hypothetical protein [bacterium]
MVYASDLPDSKINYVSGNIEVADPVHVGPDNQDIQYVISDPDGSKEIATVTDSPSDDRDPQLAIAPSGDGWVAWWRKDAGPSNSVLIRKRDHATGVWDDELVLSLDGEDSRSPAVAHDGNHAWVAYEIHGAVDTEIGVSIIIDQPDPVGIRAIVGGTGFSGLRDLRAHAASGHLWVSWVDSATEVAWVEYDYAEEQWSDASDEDYDADSVREARRRIREIVLGDD